MEEIVYKNVNENFDSEEVLLYLGKWLDIFSIIARWKKPSSKRDYDFLQLLGQSIYTLNRFTTIMIKKLQQIQQNEKDEKRKKIQSLLNYLEFNSNMVSANIKDFFYRETPNINLNNALHEVAPQIFISARDSLHYLYNIDKNEENLKYDLQRFFHLLTLLYGFIYNHDERYGIFLRFKYDNNKFTKLRQIIEKKLQSVDSEIGLRKFIHDLLPIILRENEKIDKPYKEIYKEFVENFRDYKSNEMYIEPFLYRFANILRSLDALLHDSDEFIKKADKKNFEEELIEKIKHISIDWFKEIDEIYRRIKWKKIDYKRIWEKENPFIELSYSKIIKKKDYESIKKKIEDLDKFAENFITLKLEKKNEVDWKKIKEKLMEIARGHNEEKLKFIYLLEKLNYQQLTALLNLYSDKIIDSFGKNLNTTEFVGFYKSGVFLSQFITFRNNIQNKPIWMFKVFPYVTLHPIIKNIKKIDKIIIADESIKTGFTYSLFKTYLMRNINQESLPTLYVYPFMSFTDYKRVMDEDSIQPLINISFEKEKIDFTSDKPEIRYLSVSLFNKEDKDIKEELQKKLSSEDRLDLATYISSPKMTLLFAKIFADRIKKESNKKVFIFSPSPKGEVLALWTAYLLESDGIDVYFDANVLDKDEEIYKVAIDVSKDTGFTLAYKWSIERNKKFEEKDLQNIKDEFDLILTMVERKGEGMILNESLFEF